MPSAKILSEERVQDTESENESEVEKEQVTSNTKSNSKKALTKDQKSTSQALSSGEESEVSENESTSNDEEDDEDEADDTTDTTSVSSKASVTQAAKRKTTETTTKSSEPPTKKTKTSTEPVKRIEPTTYTPPQGYKAIKPRPEDTTSKAISMFNDLTNKQIWQISAPDSFPISKLSSLDLEAALKGRSILEHQGITYTITREISETPATVFVPKPNGEYVSTNGIITNTLIIRPKYSADFGSKSQSESNVTASPPTADQTFFAKEGIQKKPPRKQPENLKARYIPFGVTTELPIHDIDEIDADADTDHDTTMTDAPATSNTQTQTQAEAATTPSSMPRSTSKNSKDKDKATSTSASSPTQSKSKSKTKTKSKDSKDITTSPTVPETPSKKGNDITSSQSQSVTDSVTKKKKKSKEKA